MNNTDLPPPAITIRNADGEVTFTNDPQLVEQLLNERTGTTTEQRQRMQDEMIRRADERIAQDKARNDGIIAGLYLGLTIGSLFVFLLMYLFGSPMKGILL